MIPNRKVVLAAQVCLAVAAICPARAADYEMTTPGAPGVASADEIDSSIGKLTLHDGLPTPETAQAV